MITCEIVAAYTQCKYKAYLLLNLDKVKISDQHEYVTIIERETKRNRDEFLSRIKKKDPEVKPFSQEEMKKGISSLLEANYTFADLEAYTDVLTITEHGSPGKPKVYTPTVVVGTYQISKEQKLILGFSGYVLSKLQKVKIVSGTIIGKENKPNKIMLVPLYNEIEQVLTKLRAWSTPQPKESPSIILNNHCPLCPFRKDCEVKAIEMDHLSLLSKISTEKQIEKYQRKGIFTVNQLSYLYRPRRQRKRSRKPPSVTHSLELQSLVMRIGKIYVHSPPECIRNNTEIYLDIEGTPDSQLFYLIGLLVCNDNASTYYSFWANDAIGDEHQMWMDFVEVIGKYIGCPIYHYGNYDVKAITTLGKRYNTIADGIIKSLININGYIYGKIYFPIRSNSLKEIGQYIGASWSSTDASGLQSLVWRHYWENNHNIEYKQNLLSYNQEDCLALKLLLEFLSGVKENHDSLFDIDCYVNLKKSRDSKTKNPLHQQLETILKFAHADYDNMKISFSDKHEDNKGHKVLAVKAKRDKKYRRVTKVIHVPMASHCQGCGNEDVQESIKISQRIKVDLIFTKNGIRKSVVKYILHYAYCIKCNYYSKSREFSKRGTPSIYEHGFKIWAVYQRVSLRLPYRNITMGIKDIFNETIGTALITGYMQEVANDYKRTEDQLIELLLASPFLHVDDTMVDINHINQNVWVFTDGKHVVYKYAKTRDATLVHEFLSTYEGVLISDFYPGFDSLKCKHQKCLVHLIRDLNNDLWSNPFDFELGIFVSNVRDLLVPIMEAIQKYGLKERHLCKFNSNVDKYYNKYMIGCTYKSSLCLKYQDRIIKYKERLFTFLNNDGIPWHNNPAENALRAIIMQLDVSKVLHESVIVEFLTLLGIKQSCKYQNKSFLKFLLSDEKYVDTFKDRKSTKQIRAS